MRIDGQPDDPGRLKNDKIELLVANHPVGTVATYLNSLILAIIHWHLASHVRIVAWVAAIWLIATGRWLLCRQFQRRQRPAERMPLWFGLIRLGVVGSGVAWGAAGLLLFPEASIGHQMITIFTIGGMVAGASTAYSAFFSVFLLFSLPAMVPVIVFAFTLADAIHQSMGAMSTLFLILMVGVYYRNNRFIDHSVKLGLANSALVSYLTEAKARAESANLELARENTERRKIENELEAHKKELESTVQKRTAELEHRNRELRHEVAGRERAQAALMDSEERYRLLVEKANIGIVLIKNETIHFANRYTAALSGYGIDEIAGKTFLDFVHPDDHALAISNYQRRLKGEMVTETYPIRFVHRSGETRWLEINAVTMTYEDQPAALLFVKDITKQRQLEAQLRQAEKMAAIGQLAAGVAHEINNPVGFVNSNLNTLKDYHVELQQMVTAGRDVIGHARKAFGKGRWHGDAARSFEALARTEAQVDLAYILEDIPQLIRESLDGTGRIRKIVLDLKDFAHPGNEELQMTNINRSIESTLNIVWNELKYHVEVVKRFGTLPDIECHPQQLNQVFMNILVNAAQAIEDQGRITIETAARNGNVEVKISDTGRGIEPSHLNKIFDPFFTTKPVGKGTGLGLNVSYNIIEQHHGSISVQSSVGKGTTFTITLPADRNHPADAPPDQVWA